MKEKSLVAFWLIIGTIAGVLILARCISKEKNVLEGDLYFSDIRIGSYYNVPDSIIKKFEKSLDTINIKTADKDTKMLLEVYRKLKDGGLLYKPFVDVQITQDSIVKLYLDSIDYDKIKIFKYQELLDAKKKVRIQANVRIIDWRFYYCTNLINIEEVDGLTMPPLGKFGIDDYH